MGGRERSGVAAAALASMMAVAALTACTAGAATPGSPAVTTSAATTSPTRATPGHYAAVDDLCARTDLSAVRAVFPHTESAEPRTTRTQLATTLVCDLVVGYTSDFEQLANLHVEVELTAEADDTARMYASARGVVAANGNQLTAVSGFGQGAYQYLDKVIGYRVDGYDGNAEISVTFKGFEPTLKLPPDIYGVLLNTARGTLAKLRAPA